MKKCIFIYGNNNIDNLFDQHPSKINFTSHWIALKNQLYKLGIELVSKNSSNLKSPDLEIHLNVLKTKNDKWPKFCILTETKYIHPDNSNINLIKKYNHSFSWDTDLVNLGLATKIRLPHPMDKCVVNGYEKRDRLVVLFGSNRSLRGWHPKKNLYSERVKTIRWFESNAPDEVALTDENGICQLDYQLVLAD